jgi:hypothetical protein
MATTPSYWTPDIVELIEEASERAGLEIRTGYQLRTARRSLNILLTEWANRGYNLYEVRQLTIPLITGQVEYTLPADVIDVIEQVIRQYPDQMNQQIDLQISRISLPTWATIPNKLTQGRPIQIYYDKLTPNPIAHIWPNPNQSGYFLNLWYLARSVSVGTSGLDDMTNIIPYRFVPALIAGLAFYISIKNPESMNRIDMLKGMYEEQWELAIRTDVEKAPLRLVPQIGLGYGNGY